MIHRLSALSLLAVLRLGVGLALIWSAGCQGPSQSAVQPTVLIATLVIENMTDYDWTVSLTARSGSHSGVTVPRRGRVTVALQPGTYRIEQRANGEPTLGGPLSRELESTFDSGITYEWPLRTLLSETGGVLP